MEKTFLKIARYALVSLIAISLLVTVVASIYSAFHLIPAKQPEAPQISIRFDEMITSLKSNSTSATSSSGQQLNVKPVISQQCRSVTSKLNSLSKQIGWNKTSGQVFNQSTMRFENKDTVDFSFTLDDDGSSKICKAIDDEILELNSRLSPHYKHVDLKAGFYAGLNAFLDAMQADSGRDEALAPGDGNRYFTLTAVGWYFEHFETAVDQARDKAVHREEEQAEKKQLGTLALYAAGSAFSFFFLCSLVLVFMRIEVNTRGLVEAVRRAESQEQISPPISHRI